MCKPVTVYGVDFTSAPGNRKPITCAKTIFNGETLSYKALEHWYSFEQFEHALIRPGPWVMGIDFPFGQSCRFIFNSGLPANWNEYVERISSLNRAEFRKFLEDYKRDRPAGDKQHKRECDHRTASQSPQTLYGTPVALMFYEGTKRLLEAGVHLPHHHDGDPARVVLEAYPGVSARRLIGKRSYKNDTKKKQTPDQHEARKDILKKLVGSEGKDLYGFDINAPVDLADDPGADDLDALLCAVQAAWGWARRKRGFGAPPNMNRSEGWICDPALKDESVLK
jgi:hypothetical protein